MLLRTEVRLPEKRAPIVLTRLRRRRSLRSDGVFPLPLPPSQPWLSTSESRPWLLLRKQEKHRLSLPAFLQLLRQRPRRPKALPFSGRSAPLEDRRSLPTSRCYALPPRRRRSARTPPLPRSTHAEDLSRQPGQRWRPSVHTLPPPHRPPQC